VNCFQFVICVVQLIAEINLSNATLPHCDIVVLLLSMLLLLLLIDSLEMCLWVGIGTNIGIGWVLGPSVNSPFPLFVLIVNKLSTRLVNLARNLS